MFNLRRIVVDDGLFAMWPRYDDIHCQAHSCVQNISVA